MATASANDNSGLRVKTCPASGRAYTMADWRAWPADERKARWERESWRVCPDCGKAKLWVGSEYR